MLLFHFLFIQAEYKSILIRLFLCSNVPVDCWWEWWWRFLPQHGMLLKPSGMGGGGA